MRLSNLTGFQMDRVGTHKGGLPSLEGGGAPPHLKGWLHRLGLLLTGRRVCAKMGHALYLIDGEKECICYQKGDVRQARDYFSGKLWVCRRCRLEWYEGPLNPYKREVLPCKEKE